MGKQNMKIFNFVGFLPHGCISRSALELITSDCSDKTPFIEYSPVISMQERIDMCERMHGYASRHIHAMAEGKYIDDSVLKYGQSHYKTFRALRLTKSGLYALTGMVDSQEEARRQQQCRAEGYTQGRVANFLKIEPEKQALLRELSLVDNEQILETEDIKEIYKELTHKVISSQAATILAIGSPSVKAVATMPDYYTGHQVYKLWRLSNTEALFRVNGFLTTIDRRPLDPAWRFDDAETLSEKASLSVYETDGNNDSYVPEETKARQQKETKWNKKKNTISICDFANETIKQWYSEHPESFFFSDPLKQLTDEEYEQWKRTPSFYPAYEIPGFGGKPKTEAEIITTGANNALRYNFIGLAIGTNCNYLVYHTRPRRTNWSENVERLSAYAVQMAIDEAGQKERVNGVGKEINYALIICASVHQFLSLFQHGKVKMPKKWRKIGRVGAPYQMVNIATLNNAGAMLVRGLMLSSPVQFEESIINSMVQKFSEFRKSNDSLYQLEYKGTPVLLAHSMNFQKLYYAWEDYQDGMEFFISCYPEQVKYIQKLMPNAKFL